MKSARESGASSRSQGTCRKSGMRSWRNSTSTRASVSVICLCCSETWRGESSSRSRMRRLRRFLTLPATDRRLLVEAVLFLAAIRLGLRLLPFRTLWRLLDRAPRPSVAAGLFSPDRIAWAVSVTSPYVLGVRPCLPQALAAQLLLVRRGFPARLRLGVARGDRGQVRAHAWMATGGRVVTGGSQPGLQPYTPRPALDSQT